MAGETIITVVGNLTADPELRYTQNGLPVANFTIASTPRNFDRAVERVEGRRSAVPPRVRLARVRRARRGFADEGHAGHRDRPSEAAFVRDREGKKRTSIELEVDEIGPSLRYATAQVTRAASGRRRWRCQRSVSRLLRSPGSTPRASSSAGTGDAGGEAWSTPGASATTPPSKTISDACLGPRHPTTT